MAETISWCRVHDGNPDDCERKIAWDESCDVVELIDPASIDYEAAKRVMRSWLVEDNDAPLMSAVRLAVDAALGKVVWPTDKEEE